MRILFLAPRFPWPPLLGYQVRAYHQLRLLSARHEITLVCFTTEPPPEADRDAIAKFCHDVVMVPHTTAGMAAGLLRGVARARPVQAAVYETPAMRRACRELLAQRRHDLAHVQLLRMAPLLDHASELPRVLELVDALSLNMERRYRLDRGPARWAAGLEAFRLHRYERRLVGSWDHCTVVSESDRRAIGDWPNLSVNASGVDLEAFPFTPGSRASDEILFTGNLGYFPNVDAVSWFAREALPRVQREVPGAHLSVVGARPAPAVRLLAGDGISVSGFVPDLKPYLTRSRVAVAPMRAGSGQLFKVLEAMACGTPVVATSLAASGIEAEAERHLLVADTPEHFAAQVSRVLQDDRLAARLSDEGRRLVEQKYSWDHSVSGLESVHQAVLAQTHSAKKLLN